MRRFNRRLVPRRTLVRAPVIRAIGAMSAGALVLGACAMAHTRSQVASPDPSILLPGSPLLSTGTFVTEHDRYVVVGDSGSRTNAHRVGASETAILPTRYRGEPALILTTSSRRGGAVFTDSALVLRRGLVPVWEIASNSRGWHARFEYDGPTVHVQSVSSDSTHRATHTYPRSVFNFNELDAIVRAVPLREGYHAIVPLYSEGSDALEMDTISVAAPSDGHAWDVRFADAVIITHYAVDAATRRFVGREVTYHRSPMRLRFLTDSTNAAVGVAGTASVIALARAGAAPVLLAPGRLSTSYSEWNTSMTPDGRTVFFSRGTFWTIMTAGASSGSARIATDGGSHRRTSALPSTERRRRWRQESLRMARRCTSPAIGARNAACVRIVWMRTR